MSRYGFAPSGVHLLALSMSLSFVLLALPDVDRVGALCGYVLFRGSVSEDA